MAFGLGKEATKSDPGGPDWNGELNPGPLEIGFDHCFLLPTTNDRVPQVYVEDHRVLNLDPKDPLWVGRKKPSADHPTGITHRSTLKMDWSHGHNATIHNGISRIGFYTGGHSARFATKISPTNGLKNPMNSWKPIKTIHFSFSFPPTTFMCPGSHTKGFKARPTWGSEEMQSSSSIGALAKS